MNIEPSRDPLTHPPAVVTETGQHDRASVGQVVATTIGAVFIIAFVLFGINNQRIESGHDETAAASAPVPAQDQAAQGAQQQPAQQQARQQQGAAKSNAPSTTGQGGGEKNNAPQNDNAAKNPAPQQPASAGEKPAQKSEQPAQPRGQ